MIDTLINYSYSGVIGFFLGILFMVFIDKLSPNKKKDE